MRARASVLVMAVLTFFPAVTAAQGGAAVDITREDINTVLESMGRSIDRQLKVVDIGVGNVAVGILHRTGANDTDGALTGLIHAQVTEVYYVLSGSGILVTGGDATDAVEFPADVTAVRELIGPSGRRTVTNGQTQTVSAGDVVVIPAGVPHGFRHIQEQITYLSIRVDPDQTLPTGYAHPSLEK